MKQPCGRNCPDRKCGCAVTCPKWAAWVDYRSKSYEEKLKADQAEKYLAYKSAKKKSISAIYKAREAAKK